MSILRFRARRLEWEEVDDEEDEDEDDDVEGEW